MAFFFKLFVSKMTDRYVQYSLENRDNALNFVIEHFKKCTCSGFISFTRSPELFGEGACFYL